MIKRKYILFFIMLTNLNISCRSTSYNNLKSTNPFQCQSYQHKDMLVKIGFEKYVDVCGLAVAAEERVPDDILLEIAAVVAEYLDSDEDGVVDDINLYKSLVSNKAFFPVVFDSSENKSQDLITRMYQEYKLDLAVVSVSGEENDVKNKIRGMMPVYEEINHVFFRYGYRLVYPEAFGTDHGSKLTLCMDKARGGYFPNIPKDYPEEAWFVIEDDGCDYSSCQTDEYFYNAFVIVTGIADMHRPEGACGHANGSDWNLCSKEKVAHTDTCIYDLILNPKYKLPFNLSWDRSYTALNLRIKKL